MQLSKNLVRYIAEKGQAIQDLDLSYRGLYDDGVEQLARLLQTIKLKTLTIAGNNISAQGAAHLAQLQIETLDISENNLGDTGAELLLKSTTIDKINLESNGVSQAVLERFSTRINPITIENNLELLTALTKFSVQDLVNNKDSIAQSVCVKNLDEDVEMQENNFKKRPRTPTHEQDENPTKIARTVTFSSGEQATSGISILGKLQNLLNKAQNNPNKIDADDFFTKLSEAGLTWFDAVKYLVLENVDIAKSKANFMALVNYRDVIDADLYEQAIRRAFDKQNFNLQVTPKGNSAYEVNIYKGQQDNATVQTGKPLVTISIIAPGSRELTSDIDTTLTVEFKTLDASLLNATLLGEGTDYTTRLQASLIEAFNDLSQAKYKMTSSLHRDSNAYTSGFLAHADNPRAGIYPVFQSHENEELNCQLDENIWLFNKAAYREFYANERLQKHQWEMAASFVSFRQAYGKDWNNFEKQLTERLKEDFEDAETHKAVTSDIEAIFKILSELHQQADIKHTHQAELKLISDSDYGNNSPFEGVGHWWQKDMEVAVMNKLYVKQLLALAKINYYIKALDSIINNNVIDNKNHLEKKSLKLELKELAEELEAEKEFVSSLEDKPKLAAMLKNAKSDLQAVEQKYQQAEKELKETYKTKAKLLVERQALQIQAGLFANQAYVNRAAPYHVVLGMQLQKPIVKTKHVILGSVLQQIGFLLLHRQELKKEGYSEAQQVYKLAKYGQRLADLILNQMNRIQNTGKQIQQGKAKLSVLKDLKENPNFNGLFDAAHYDLLKLFIEAALIKKNKIPNRYYQSEYEKIEAIAQLINEQSEIYGKSQELLESMATQLISTTYDVKLEKKQGKLWGHTFFKPVAMSSAQLFSTKVSKEAQLFKIDKTSALTQPDLDPIWRVGH